MTLALLVVLAAAASLAPSARAAAGLQWTTPTQIDGSAPFSTGGRIESLTCPEASMCAAIDFNGFVLTSTSPADAVYTAAKISTPDGLQAIDCASASRCVAADRYGNVVATSNATGGAGGGRRRAWARARSSTASPARRHRSVPW